MTRDPSIPVLLFGAFDRHNVGDLLFAHVAAALLPGRRHLFAGLAARDLRPWSGHRVKALARLAARWRDRPLHIVHAGGELLTCDAWEAAVMLLPPEQALAAIVGLDAGPEERRAWAQQRLGFSDRVAYAVPRALFPQARGVVYNAVGGVGLDLLDAPMRAEAVAKLNEADYVGVRDGHTHALLAAAGIAARLLPDSAVMIKELFAPAIQARATRGETARMMEAFPKGYIAVQFSADFGDDRTLDAMAEQLSHAAAEHGCGIVLFRAGAAPWHDDIRCYRRLAARMRAAPRIFTSLDVWDICALIAGSRAYLGSSLHGRIVAMAYALPRLNLRSPADTARVSKQSAFAATWDIAGMPAAVEVADIAEGMRRAVGIGGEQLQRTAASLTAAYRAEFALEAACLGPL